MIPGWKPVVNGDLGESKDVPKEAGEASQSGGKSSFPRITALADEDRRGIRGSADAGHLKGRAFYGITVTAKLARLCRVQ